MLRQKVLCTNLLSSIFRKLVVKASIVETVVHNVNPLGTDAEAIYDSFLLITRYRDDRLTAWCDQRYHSSAIVISEPLIPAIFGGNAIHEDDVMQCLDDRYRRKER